MTTPKTKWPQRIVILAGLYAIAGGLITLAGWVAGIPRLTQWKDDGIAMFPNTALAAVLAGGALLLMGKQTLRPAARALALLVLSVGALTLFEHVSGIDLRIDGLLAEGDWGEVAAAAPLRMGPPASVSFTLIGLALILAGLGARMRAYAVGLGLAAIAISSLSITGHLYGATQMYMLPRWTGIAFQTATMILALGAGIVCAVPERQPLRLLLDDSAAGSFARRVLPLVVLLPLALGWGRVLIQNRGWVDTAFGTALRTLIEIVLLTVLLWRGLTILLARERSLTDTEKEVRRQAGQLGALLDTAAIALSRADPDGVIVWANDEELKLVGYARDEYVAHHVAEFHEDKAAILAVLDRLRRGETVREHVSRIVRKDGSKRTVLLDASVVREDGAIAWIQFFTRDITERVKAEESRALLASIVKASDDAIVSKTLDGVITSWNGAAERLFGWSAEEAIGNRIDLIIPEDRMDEERTILTRIRRGHAMDHFETVRKTKSGRLIDVSITVSPMRDQAGSIIGASKIARDVSDRKRLEAEREEQNRRKDEFIAILAHELRNPLAPIRNAAHYLSSLDNENLKHPVGIIDRQVTHMARLIDDLLDVSRISRGVLELRRERASCAEIVEAAIEATRDEMKSRNHTLHAELPKEHVEVEADRARVVQILSNLLGNAAKYTPPGGLIELRVAAEGPVLEISIRDDGIGIPPDKLDHVFELFARVEDSLEKQGGLGIGLTLARQIAELHGGTIEARSAGLGFGSEFRVKLPIVVQEPVETAVEDRRTRRPCTPRRVLVADDNRDVAESLAMLLEFSGHEVHCAFDGEAAVRAAEEVLPEVALLDIGMPKANGYEVATRIRSNVWGRQIFLVALTGWGQEADKKRAEIAGFDMHLVKPVAPETIEQLLETLPERRQAV